jgi:hypothetical protein
MTTTTLTYAALDAALPVEGPRQHLGMSQIGKPDTRMLWMQFHWCLIDAPEQRMRRLFALGNTIEGVIIDLLRKAGITIHDQDDDGNQFRFSEIGGHFGGSMDGCAIGVPDAPEEWHVFEAKSASAKRFKELQKLNSVAKWAPEYYTQMQCYMGASGMEWALFVAYCKDNSELYVERVPFVPTVYPAMLAKAERIITDTSPPESIYKETDIEVAKFMSQMARDIYLCKRLPAPNCRNCRFSAPVDGGWNCDLHCKPLDYKRQLHGCKKHVFLHSIMPAALEQFGDTSSTYKTADGAVFQNVAEDEVIPHGQCYSSKELANFNATDFCKAFIEDKVLAEFKTELGATIMGEQA